MAEQALTDLRTPHTEASGLRSIATDFSSDRQAFRNVSWGKDLPVVYRWAYDYSVPGADQDFLPQNQPGTARSAMGPAHG